MDPNQSRNSQQRTINVDPIGIEQRNDPPIGSTNTGGIDDPIQTPQAPLTGTVAPDRFGARVWNRPGDRPPIDSSIIQNATGQTNISYADISNERGTRRTSRYNPDTFR
ncbi:Uncharacterized protein Rs2_09628 [Raphanus sativus]|nr:Uncharacterized protein Rs2_09628 [Raphanus sativus]